MNLVIDAAAAVEYLLRTPIGLQLAPTVEGAVLFGPELLDAEVLAVVRRETLRGRITLGRASEAIQDLAQWDVERISHRALLDDAWSLRDNVSAYDALYVAVARFLGAALLTADGPLSRAPALGIPIYNVRI